MLTFAGFFGFWPGFTPTLRFTLRRHGGGGTGSSLGIAQIVVADGLEVVVELVYQWNTVGNIQFHDVVGMATLLLARVKQYWEGQVDALLLERVAEVDELVRQMQAAPQEKAVRLAALRAEAEALRAVVGELA